jgi:hypothetical protein
METSSVRSPGRPASGLPLLASRTALGKDWARVTVQLIKTHRPPHQNNGLRRKIARREISIPLDDHLLFGVNIAKIS